MLQEPEVIGHAVSTLGNGGQHIQNAAVGLSGIGLAADGEAALKAEGGGDPAVHLVDFRPVALKEIHEAGLGAGGAPAAQEAQSGQHVIQLLQIGAEILHPQCGPLAHRHRLGGLIVGVAQSGRGSVLPGKGRQIHQNG